MPSGNGEGGNLSHPEKKTLYLHIGYGKTGTSSLQSFFARNMARLASLGVYYPFTGRGGLDGHHFIATAARPGGGTGYDTKLDWPGYFSYLKNEVASRPEPKILISSEVFSGRMTWRYLENLKAVFSEIRIVVYIRRQDTLIASNYNQWVKGENLTKRLDDLQLLPFNFDVALENWEKLIGRHPGGLIVRPFERGQIRNANVIDDFMYSVFGIEVDETFTPPEPSQANQRLSLDALEFKRLLNCHCPRDISSQFIGPLVRYSERALRAAPEDEGAIFTPQERREIMAVFEPGNVLIAKRYMNRPDGVLFEPLPSEQIDGAPPPELTFSVALDIARFVLADRALHAAQEGAAGAAQAAPAPRLEDILDTCPGPGAASDENRILALVRGVAAALHGDFPERTEEDHIGTRWAKV